MMVGTAGEVFTNLKCMVPLKARALITNSAHSLIIAQRLWVTVTVGASANRALKTVSISWILFAGATARHTPMSAMLPGTESTLIMRASVVT